MKTVVPWILSVVALVGFTNAQEAAPKKKLRSGNELHALYQSRSDHWSKLPSNKRESYSKAVFGDWSVEELKLVFPQWRFRELSTDLMRQWATLDPEGALAQIEWLEKKKAHILERSTRELEGGGGAMISVEIAEQMKIVFSAWSKKEPLKVWSLIENKKGFLADSIPFRHHASSIAGSAFGGLVKVKPDYAFSRIVDQEDWLWKNKLLNTFCDHCPKSKNWKKRFTNYLNSKGLDSRGLHAVYENMMGRWLEDDPIEASNWYAKNAPKLLSFERTQYSDEGDIVHKITPSLGGAVAFWFRRDPLKATAWIIRNKSSFEKDKRFAPSFLRQRAYGYFQSKKLKDARATIGRLESQKDRGILAEILGPSLFGLNNTPYNFGTSFDGGPLTESQLKEVFQEIKKMNLGPTSSDELYRRSKAIAQSPKKE